MPDKRSRTTAPSSGSAPVLPLSAAQQALAAAHGSAGLQPRQRWQSLAGDAEQRDAADETLRREGQEGDKRRPLAEETAEAMLLDETLHEQTLERPTGQHLGGMVTAARFAAEAEASGRQQRRRLGVGDGLARTTDGQHRLGKLDVTPAAFRDQSLGAGAGLLPVLHHDPYRCAEDRVYDAC